MALALIPFLVFCLIGFTFRIVDTVKDSSIIPQGKFLFIGARIVMIVWAVVLATLAIVHG